MNKHSSQLLRTLMALVLAVCASTDLKAQLKVEYFFDSDPGYGQGSWMAATTDADGNFSFQAPTTTLEPGRHLLGFRAYLPGNPNAAEESDRSDHYAPTIIQEVYVPQSETPVITYVEYFWDTDPGAGMGTKLDITPASELNLTNIEIPTDGLSKGSHLLGIRAKGERGWSPLIMQEVYVPEATSGSTDVTRVEYFWDIDPGFGKGTPLPFTKGQEVSIDNAAVSIDGLTVGDHQLFVRAFGNNGWTPTLSQTIYVEPDAASLKVLQGEYFWNDDPGYGQGTPITLTEGQEISIQDFPVPSGSVHGDAVLFVRYRGTMGWSPTVAYPVMVDAEGNYTLNSGAATSMANRNYQTLADAFDDFDDRGISGDITLTVKTKSKTYELDVTDETRIAQVARLAQNLNDISKSRDHKTIAFTSTSAGNVISVTTTDEALPTVVSLFAQTSLQNVTLTINGTAYDFTAAASRHQIGCATTTAVSLSAISEAVKASWTAQPHDATTLSGFVVEGAGNLPEMTIANSGTKTDSVAYQVTLTTADDLPLCSYTYYIYVYAPMQNQAFTTLTPVTGSILDPKTTKLTWNAFNDATGYRIVVNEAAEGGDPAEIINKTVTAQEYEITVKEGYSYTWTVTAIGPCDELTSPEMTLEGRLLPDLIVESVTLPEAAPAGSELTVTATIKNQGRGATTEDEWTDRLYYTISSTKFADAVQAVDLKHEGNMEPNDTYDVEFTMQVPYVESGDLRVFVETNADKAAMEHDATTDNNRLMSSNKATMTPFYINETDLAALRQLYNDFGGSQWNGTKWNAESALVANGNWSGVTFNSDGHVTTITLQGRGLTGSLSTASPYAATMLQLTSINLSRNALTGDPSVFLEGVGAQLTTVDLSYNQIDELSAALPTTITNLSLKSQHRKYNANATLPGLENLTAQTLNISNRMEVEVFRIVGYNHSAQTFGNIQTLKVYRQADMGQLLGYLKWSPTYESYYYEGYSGHPVQPQEQDDNVVIVPAGGPLENSAYPAHFHMVSGDANLSGLVDVNDVQRTLNHIVSPNSGSTFSLWAANTWKDDLINIQDIVCTVNIVLDNQGDGNMAPRRAAANNGAPNRFYVDGRYIMLEAEDEIAAFDLEIEGVKATQVRLLLNRNDWQMQTRETENGVRLVVFSPTCQVLPEGTTQLLRLSGDGEPVAAQATSIDATEVEVGVGEYIEPEPDPEPEPEPDPEPNPDDATGINEMTKADDSPVYDLSGRRIYESQVRKGIYIKNGKKVKK